MNSLDTKRAEVERLSKDTLDFGHSIKESASSADLDKFQRMTEELRQKRDELATLENHPLSRQGDPVHAGIIHSEDDEVRSQLEAWEDAPLLDSMPEMDADTGEYRSPCGEDPVRKAMAGFFLGDKAHPEFQRAARSMGLHVGNESRMSINLPYATHRIDPDTGRPFHITNPNPTVQEVRDLYRRQAEHAAKYAKHGAVNPRTAGADFEQRQQAVGTGPAGGYTVAEETIARIEVAIRLETGMRLMSRIAPTPTGAEWPWPMNDDLSVLGEIVAENAQVTEQDLAFGLRKRKANKYSSKLVRASIEYLQDTSTEGGSFILTQLGRRIGRLLNNHLTTGTGTTDASATEPEGIVTAAPASGITTVGTALSSVTYKTMLDFLHSVDPAHRAQPNCGWMFHDDVLRVLRQLQDDRNRPIWNESLVAGVPSTLMGFPYIVNNSMPKGDSAATIFALFGDMNQYVVRDASVATTLVLRERYADFGQVGFLLFSRHDGFLSDATNATYGGTTTAAAPIKSAATAAA